MKKSSNPSGRIAKRGAGLYRDILLLRFLTLVTTVASLIAEARRVWLPAVPQVQGKNHVVNVTPRAVRAPQDMTTSLSTVKPYRP